jgi:hypothetical protein
MRLLDRLSKSQRVIVVVAIGLGLWLAGRDLVSLGFLDWTGRVPLATARLHPLTRAVIWLVLIGLWALAAVKVLRRPGDRQAVTATGGQG